MVLCLCVLIVFLLCRESLKLILSMDPFSRWFSHRYLNHRQGGEAQAAKMISDELKTPKMDGSAWRRNMVWQTLITGSGDERQ
jgi:hypothetical protein